MADAATASQRRVAGWLPEVVLAIAAIAIGVNWALLIDAGFQGDPIMTGADIVAWVAAAIVRWKRPDHPASLWLALFIIPGASLTEAILDRLTHTGAGATPIAWANFGGIAAGAVSGVVGFYAIGLYPVCRPETRAERRIIPVVWLLALPPLITAFATSTIPFEYYANAPELANPLHILPFTVPSVLAASSLNSLVAILIGSVLIVRRYRRSDPVTRRRIRVLLLPLSVVVVGILSSIVFQGRLQVVTWILVTVAVYSFAPTLAAGILQPPGLDLDAVVRRVMVYGALWLVVAAAFVAAGTIVGIAAGAYLSVEWSVAVALVAAMLFQPARARLDRLVSRWVFGRRTDPATVIERLGETLAMTFDMNTLLSRMVAALEDGLGVEWANVRLNGESDPEVIDTPSLSAPITLDGEELGVVECGPKRRGNWTDADRRVVATFAGQAALAVHNLKLTDKLTEHVAQLAASRARMVRAGETERRRIERNIHDGVQQDLVALIALAGQLRGAPLDHTANDLAALHDGLTRVLAELRDLAKGIHPSLLSDQGLLVAVEALAARHPTSVAVRADPGLRGMTFAPEAEGAIYFAVAEALANSLKHSEAEHVDVTLARQNGSLLTTITDDGVGFASNGSNRAGSGLAGLRDRITALDGRLDVQSAPGRGTTVLAEVAVTEVAP